jgi:hypothetical protein
MVEQLMSPSDVRDYLKALRDGGCMSAELVLPGGAAIRAVFAPDAPPGDAITKEPEPGAWKWKGDAE